ncbi:MAG: SAM-dependent methyltransferase [Flavobacteriales bacterium]|nr:MAG: SAM-dependent methyltransferase [Flavobacteriales bacterium]
MDADQQDEEVDRIETVYAKRKVAESKAISTGRQRYTAYAIGERDRIITRIMRNAFTSFEDLQMIEIGAGYGGNLWLFRELGIPWEGIWANELLPDRVEAIRKNLPELKNIEEGDACVLNHPAKFDLIFLSTVLTSILDMDFKLKLCQKVLEMTKPGGKILIYDFIYDNPGNTSVKGVARRELIKLFEGAANIEFYKTTLAPPIGKRIGGLYPFFNSLFPFLRTHLITTITK